MSCLLCKKENLKKVYTPPAANGRSLCRCAGCSLLQMVPMPSEEELSTYYQNYDIMGEREPYYERLWKDNAWETQEGTEIVDRFSWSKRFYNFSGKTLDVGSGPGLFLKLVKDDGGQAIGCELNAVAAERSAARFNVQVYSGTIDSVSDKDFDAICLWDVLEHVNNPQKLVADAASRLKKDGWIFIETPNEAALLDRVVLGLNKIGLKGPAAVFYGLHHLVLFRPRTIRRLLEENGFTIASLVGAETNPGRVFRGNGFKDKMTRLVLGGLFLFARIIGRRNKMLIAARKN